VDKCKSIFLAKTKVDMAKFLVLGCLIFDMFLTGQDQAIKKPP